MDICGKSSLVSQISSSANSALWRYHIFSFGDGGFKYKKQLLKKEAELTGWFDEVVIHSSETIFDFLNEHRDFVKKNKRGYGYWIWKPHIILKLLEQINKSKTN